MIAIWWLPIVIEALHWQEKNTIQLGYYENSIYYIMICQIYLSNNQAM